MNIRSLKQELEKSGIPAYVYNLTGHGRNDERLCIEKEHGEWYVYYLERGIKTFNKIFDSEDAACQFMYDRLVADRKR